MRDIIKNNAKKAKERLHSFLIDMQRVTGIDNVYFLKGGFWMLLLQGVTILSGLMLSVAFARYGTKALYGKYQFILSVFAIMFISTLPGANPALMQAVTRGKEKTFTYLFKEKLKLSAFGSIGLIFCAAYFEFIRSDATIAITILISSFALFFSFWNTYINSFFIGRGNFKKSNSYLIYEKTITTAAICTSLLINPEFFTIMITYFITLILVNCIGYLKFKRSYKLKGEILKESKKDSFTLTKIQIIPRITQNIDKIIIPIFLGIEAVAVYTIALIMVETIKSSMSMMQNVAFKKMVDLPREKILPKLKKGWISASFLAIMITMVIAFPYLILFFYGEQYEQSIYLAQIYTLIIPLNFIWEVFHNWLLANKKMVTYSYFLNGFYIFGAIIFISMLAITKTLLGAIIARIIVIGLFAILSIIYIKKPFLAEN